MSERHTKIKNILEIAGYILLTLLICFFLQRLTKPKYMSHPYEGAMISEYYKDEAAHDVIFLGDCEFYETISPIKLWEGFGISSYVRGSPQQLIWQSYYILLDTLEHETPKVVVFNAMEMKIGEVQNEAYTRLTLDDVKSLKYRLAAAKLSLKEENESLVSYFFPLLRYHSRWSDLTKDDIIYLFGRDLISYNGYLMQTGVEPQTGILHKPPLFDYTFSDICWEYLDKIASLCKEKGIELVIFKAPTESWQYPWYDEWNNQLVQYSETNNIPYINGLDYTEDMGLDMSSDTYDKGVHLNVYGAEKCSAFLGQYLKENFELPDRRTDNAQASLWEKLCERYNSAKEK